MAAALAACGGRAEPAMDDAWIRLPAVPGRPAAAYFTLHGGGAGATLVSVRTMARRAELHESMANGMRAIPLVAVPAAGEVRFAPGGRHVMIFDLDPAVKKGERVTIYGTLANGREISAMATAVGAADPAP